MPRPRLHPVSDADRVRIGQNLREARKHIGLTLAQVAERTDTRYSTVQNYEKGRLRVTPERLAELAGIYGVTVDHLTRESVTA